jgi:hypothetical protein
MPQQRYLLVAGQIVGALAQGIGQALLEHFVYGEAGELITGTFMGVRDAADNGSRGNGDCRR